MAVYCRACLSSLGMVPAAVWMLAFIRDLKGAMNAFFEKLGRCRVSLLSFEKSICLNAP